MLRILIDDNCGPRGGKPTRCVAWVAKTRMWVRTAYLWLGDLSFPFSRLPWAAGKTTILRSSIGGQ